MHAFVFFDKEPVQDDYWLITVFFLAGKYYVNLLNVPDSSPTDRVSMKAGDLQKREEDKNCESMTLQDIEIHVWRLPE